MTFLVGVGRGEGERKTEGCFHAWWREEDQQRGESGQRRQGGDVRGNGKKSDHSGIFQILDFVLKAWNTTARFLSTGVIKLPFWRHCNWLLFREWMKRDIVGRQGTETGLWMRSGRRPAPDGRQVGAKRSKSVPAGFGGIFSLWLSARIAAKGEGGVWLLNFWYKPWCAWEGRGGEYCTRRTKLSVVLIHPNGNAKSTLGWMELKKKSELDLGTWEFWTGT